ncbi:MAG: PD40 domain-containing protein [Phycisphaeraceae bacterium]|nr:PD40 domain-containing protein [Phycisphaeraceae bacterium]
MDTRFETQTTTRLPVEGMTDGMMWSNDGRQIAYSTFTNKEFSIWERPAVPSGGAAKMFATPIAQQLFVAPSAWSPDGKILAIVQSDIKTNKSDVLMLEQEPDSTEWKCTPYLNSPVDEHALRFSPDGKWVVFCSVESGRHELYAQRFTGAGSGAKDAASGRVQISTSGHDGGV